jgi:hypothetical protein
LLVIGVEIDWTRASWIAVQRTHRGDGELNLPVEKVTLAERSQGVESERLINVPPAMGGSKDRRRLTL